MWQTHLQQGDVDVFVFYWISDSKGSVDVAQCATPRGEISAYDVGPLWVKIFDDVLYQRLKQIPDGLSSWLLHSNDGTNRISLIITNRNNINMKFVIENGEKSKML